MIPTLINSKIIIRIGQGALSVATLHAPSSISDYEAYSMKSGISSAANLREAFKETELLKKTYDHAEIMLVTPTMLVPADEYRADDADVIYDHTFSGLSRSVKLSQTLPGLHAVAVFSIDKDLKTVFDDHFDRVRFVPVSLPVWQYFHLQDHGMSRQRLYGYFHDGQMDVFCFHQSRFKYSNTFQTSQAHDALYFLLYTFRQLGMKGERDSISVIGNIPQKKWLIERMRTYVGEVSAPDAKETGLPEQLRFPSIPYDMQVLISQISQ